MSGAPGLRVTREAGARFPELQSPHPQLQEAARDFHSATPLVACVSLCLLYLAITHLSPFHRLIHLLSIYLQPSICSSLFQRLSKPSHFCYGLNADVCPACYVENLIPSLKVEEARPLEVTMSEDRPSGEGFMLLQEAPQTPSPSAT